MFPANELILAAEIDYRRERLMAVRPQRPRRRFRRVPRRATIKQILPGPGQGVLGTA